MFFGGGGGGGGGGGDRARANNSNAPQHLPFTTRLEDYEIHETPIGAKTGALCCCCCCCLLLLVDDVDFVGVRSFALHFVHVDLYLNLRYQLKPLVDFVFDQY